MKYIDKLTAYHNGKYYLPVEAFDCCTSNWDADDWIRVIDYYNGWTK
ncbi:hypothetical protein [Vibrio phage VpV262]|uniref:Uncharacterized protein n=1 Tax=Vibrio phage VpV262 TaxID=2907796 RepID=Q8LT95_9CAUD|nr:hypothetical protein VpV262p04 [Vibrio phage VpV262]AAM28352.1 hypothetical protein [Vibrio phage VpV262]